jgi:hypothetical protein
MSLSRIEAWKRFDDPDGFTKLAAGMSPQQIRAQAAKRRKIFEEMAKKRKRKRV